MVFDIKTIVLLLGVGNLIILIFLLIYILSGKTKNRLIHIYATGKLLMILAFFLFAFRGFVSDKVSIIPGNAFVLMGLAIEVFCMVSTRRNYSRKLFFYFLIPSIIYAIIFSFLLNAPENLRIGIVSFHYAAYTLTGSILISATRKKTGMQLFMSALYLLSSLAFFGRIYIALFKDHSFSLFTGHPIQVISFIFFMLITQFGVIYMLISFKEQDEEEIRKINKLMSTDNELLKQLNAKKDKLFSIISHDLRSPIGSLTQLVDLLNEKDHSLEPSYRQRIMDTLRNNLKSTYLLLNNLLLWARSESGKMNYHPVSINLNDLVEENIRLVQCVADIKMISISGFSERVTVFADHEMLDSTVRNLLSNAIKFTPRNGNIRIELVYNPDKTFTLSIIDTGVGIQDEILNHLFDPDSDYSSIGTDNERGSGLGLKLCREFVEKNKGRLWAESEPGKGSTFCFTVPASSN
jgi:two-component system, sensor histidine kinase and response regulator